MADPELTVNFEVEVPEGADPCPIRFPAEGWSMLLAEREQTKSLPAEWDKSFVYLLLGTPIPGEKPWLYVGKAPEGGKKRFINLREKKDWWQRALLIRRNSEFPLDSTDCSWLEQILLKEIRSRGDVKVTNDQTPDVKTLVPHKKSGLQKALPLVNAVVRFLGIPLINDDAPELKEAQKKSRDVVSRLFEADAMGPGTSLRIRAVGGDRATLDSWLQHDEKRATASWGNSPNAPLTWAYNGETYPSVKALVQHICKEAGVEYGKARRGTDWFWTEDGQSLVQLADQTSS